MDISHLYIVPDKVGENHHVEDVKRPLNDSRNRKFLIWVYHYGKTAGLYSRICRLEFGHFLPVEEYHLEEDSNEHRDKREHD